MTKTLSLLTILALIFGGIIGSYLLLPTLISYQDQIDPKNIHDDYQATAKVGIFNNNLINVPTFSPDSQILGESDPISNPSTKRIEVDLTTQHLYGYENNQLVYDFIISSGKWDRTPTGTFTVWTKIRSQKMSGGSKELGTYYYLPNVPYILFFYNDNVPKKYGYSLHGTYWHNNFGVPMSHGCINMKTPDVAQIFSWADVGTQISIYGKYVGKIASR